MAPHREGSLPKKQTAWLYVALANEEELVAEEDLLVTDIRVGEPPPDPDYDKTQK